jgi:hypothetical protein
MVRAILAGSKTQTRRVMKLAPRIERYGPREDARRFYSNGSGQYPGGNPAFTGDQPPGAKVPCRETCQTVPCPYGHIGDRLWVREAWSLDAYGSGYEITYRADGATRDIPTGTGDTGPWCRLYDTQRGDWRPSIHMPRGASRLILEIVSVRVERLNAISYLDAEAEGVQADTSFTGVWAPDTLRTAFRDLWGSIHGPDAWAANPWVWAVEFRRVAT